MLGLMLIHISKKGKWYIHCLDWHLKINSLTPASFGSVMFKLILVIDRWGISCEIVLMWLSLDLTDDKSTLILITAWCHQATSHYGSQPLHWASGNSLVIQLQSSVSGIWTPVYIQMPLEKDVLVASVSSALPAAFEWCSSVFQLCKLILDCHWDHSLHRISAGSSLLFKRCVSLTLTRLLSAWRQGESF